MLPAQAHPCHVFPAGWGPLSPNGGALWVGEKLGEKLGEKAGGQTPDTTRSGTTGLPSFTATRGVCLGRPYRAVTDGSCLG